MKLVHRLEGAAVRAALGLVRRLGPERASNLFGSLARAVGPLLPVSKVALRNLEMTMPELDRAGRRRIMRGVWENLGRTTGEFPYIGGLGQTESGPGFEVVGGEHIAAMLERGGPAIMFTGHFSNWEVLPLVTVRQGVRLATLYRAADNPIIDRLILDMRLSSVGPDRHFFPKGSHGARQALMHLRQGGVLGLLQDQKMNDGIEARFFGRPAMTASALAALALKLGCPVVPAYPERIGPARFRVHYEAPIPLPDSGNRAADILALTQAVNDRLEAWIRAAPESWLWVHRRWPKASYADLR